MLASIDQGLVDVVVAWHHDRLHRSPRELEDFILLLERTGTTVVTVTAGEYDLATPEGRLTARIVGSVARKESEDKSRRLRRKHLELAEAGRPVGGRAFGYQRGGMLVDDVEAQLVLEATRRVLAGESLWAIVGDWTARGVPTVRGAPWSTTALKTIVTAPRVAGLRVHRGQIVGEAAWPVIVDRPMWEQARAVLTQRSRRRERPARAYLLTGGLAQCGTCRAAAALVAAPRPYGRAYACLTYNGGCNGVSIVADPLEAYVAHRLAVAVRGGLLDKVRRSAAGDGRDLTGLILAEEARLVEYAVMRDGGEISHPEWRAMRKSVQRRLEGLQRELATRSAPVALEGATAGGWPGLWEAAPFERKRALMAALVERVTAGTSRV